MTDPPAVRLCHSAVPGEVRVRLEYIPQHFGSARAWARCPECDRRIRYLYRVGAWALRAACAACAGLTYPSTREPFPVRSNRKLRRLRSRLDACVGPGGGALHRTTRARLRARLYEAEERHGRAFLAEMEEAAKAGTCSTSPAATFATLDVILRYGSGIGIF